LGLDDEIKYFMFIRSRKCLNALFAGLIVLPRSKSKFAENVPELKYQEIASRQPK
jgi:hypothetical protein